MRLACEALSLAFSTILVLASTTSQAQTVVTVNQPLNQNNGVCLCQAPPFNLSSLMKLHDDGCDARIERKKEVLALNGVECSKRDTLLEVRHREILTSCEENFVAGQNICNLQTTVANLELQKCLADCSKPPINERLVTIDSLVQLPTGLYYISKPTDNQFNWYLADLFCKSNGLELASIESQEEHNAIVGALGGQGDRFWISGSDLGSENRFYCAGNGKLMSFRAFDTNEPSNSGNAEHCVQYWRSRPGNPYRWNDESCSSRCRFICEAESS